MTTISEFSSDSNEVHSSDRYKQIILLPYKYLTQISDKKTLITLLQAFNAWLNVCDDKLKLVIEIIETLRGRSLILDDINYKSMSHNGLPTAHAIYGISMCLNTCGYALATALDVINKRFPHHIVIEASKIALEVHSRQMLDFYWRDNEKCPTENEYLYVEEKKRGELELGVRLLQMFSEDKTDYMPLIKLLGQLLKIRDDYLNLKLNDYSESKGFAEDITEGKFSFPIIHAINNNGKDIEILSILKQRTTNVDLKKYLISLLEKNGSLAYTYKTIVKLDNECRKMVNQFGGNPVIINYLDKLTV